VPVLSGASGLVGSGGLEPPTPCVSGRCSDRVSYEPAEGGGPDPQRLPAQPGSSRRLPEQLHLPSADDGGPDPQPVTRPIPLRTGGRAPGGFIIQSGWRRTRTCPRLSPRPPVSGRAPCQLGQPSSIERRAENSNPMPQGTIRLATGPGTPVRFALHAYPPWDSNPDNTRSERAGSPNWPRRAWSDRPDSNWRPRLGEPGC
jgi:hypothetical protein